MTTPTLLCPACGRDAIAFSARTSAAGQSVKMEFVHHDGKICAVEFTHASMVKADSFMLSELRKLDDCLRLLPPHLSKFARKALRRVSVGRVDDGDITGSVA